MPLYVHQQNQLREYNPLYKFHHLLDNLQENGDIPLLQLTSLQDIPHLQSQALSSTPLSQPSRFKEPSTCLINLSISSSLYFRKTGRSAFFKSCKLIHNLLAYDSERGIWFVEKKKQQRLFKQ